VRQIETKVWLFFDVSPPFEVEEPHDEEKKPLGEEERCLFQLEVSTDELEMCLFLLEGTHFPLDG
jgi:hypothetical protein